MKSLLVLKLVYLSTNTGRILPAAEREEVYDRGIADSALHVLADEWSKYSVVRAT